MVTKFLKLLKNTQNRIKQNKKERKILDRAK